MTDKDINDKAQSTKPEAEEPGYEIQDVEPEEDIREADEATDTQAAELNGEEPQASSLKPQEEEIEKLKAELEKGKKEYLFLMADFDNFRKRVLKEKADLIKNGAEKALRSLLPIVDDFERGLEATKNAEDAAAVREGMELIYNKLVKYLADNGVTPLPTEAGADFDPELHEAIATIPAPSPELKGKIVDTTQRGYSLNGDRVLRHAKVVVGE